MAKFFEADYEGKCQDNRLSGSLRTTSPHWMRRTDTCRGVLDILLVQRKSPNGMNYYGIKGCSDELQMETKLVFDSWQEIN